jgi:hypothetical protein
VHWVWGNNAWIASAADVVARFTPAGSRGQGQLTDIPPAAPSSGESR